MKELKSLQELYFLKLTRKNDSIEFKSWNPYSKLIHIICFLNSSGISVLFNSAFT